ncbi:ABC transporter substrate-binding protein [Catenulispora pinistramenti]|uniref:ABC transporter substrate-binding protein n=1 Tax=Catenulispora pinistramenti TaxID=2705254 RepID=UPI002E77ABCA|nr:ABC transporter substrate-binding protein [Catenulispora pinistramenti]
MFSTKKMLTVAAAGVLSLTALSACSSSKSSGASASSGSAPGASKTTQHVTLMVGGIDKQIYLPYKLADQLGFYKKYNVDVSLSTEQDGGVGAEDAMVSGQVDMAGAWYNHAIDFQMKHKSVEDVVQLSGAPGEREMCSTKSNVHSGADFAGKTMGVTDLGSGTDTLTQLLAAQAGVPKTKFSRTGVGDGSTAIAALKNGSISCVMTTQPTVTAIEKENVGTSAIDLATTAGATKALGGAWPAAGVLVRTDWANQHQEAVQDVVDALVETMHWINTHSATDIANALPATYTNNAIITKADYITALTMDKDQFLPDGIMPAGGPKVVLATEKLIGNADDSINLGATFTNSYAVKANQLEGSTMTTTPAGANG